MTSADEAGGMTALVDAVQQVGFLNVVSVPHAGSSTDGAIIVGCTKRCPITIDEANFNDASGQELTTVQQGEGRVSTPDVVQLVRATRPMTRDGGRLPR